VASLPGGGGAAAHSGPRSPRRAPGREAAIPSPSPSPGQGETRILVYTRNIGAGEILAAEDVQWSSTAVAGDGALDDPAQAIGKSARHPVRVGAPVEAYDLARPKLIRAGDSVEVAYKNDGVVLTLLAKATSDATLGDTVEVMNTTSKTTFEAVASGPGRALVGPEADALKASMLSPPLRTAALN
jgi:flagella basal body P-ring formation protein FlgA